MGNNKEVQTASCMTVAATHATAGTTARVRQRTPRNTPAAATMSSAARTCGMASATVCSWRGQQDS